MKEANRKRFEKVLEIQTPQDLDILINSGKSKKRCRHISPSHKEQPVFSDGFLAYSYWYGAWYTYVFMNNTDPLIQGIYIRLALI